MLAVGNYPQPLALAELTLMAFLSLLGSVALTLHFVAIALRIVLNLSVAQRRRKYLRETIVCLLAFISLTFAAYAMIAGYISAVRDGW